MSEAIALPTEPQPLPHFCFSFFSDRSSLMGLNNSSTAKLVHLIDSDAEKKKDKKRRERKIKNIET